VVKSVQYRVRHHATCTVETMPLALERHGEFHQLIGKPRVRERARLIIRQRSLKGRCEVGRRLTR
jgi:hypothetical protein